MEKVSKLRGLFLLQGLAVFLDLLIMNEIKQFLKKQWSNIALVLLIVLLIVPQTGTPIKVALHKLISFSPSIQKTEARETLSSYNWRLEQLSGDIINFERSKNKVAVINYWATWCAPCIAEMPSLQALYDSFGDGIDFYFVTNERKETIQSFLNKKGYTFPVYIQKSLPPEHMQSTALPTTYVINKTGEIVISETGAANWNSKTVNELLNELLKN